MSSEKKGVQTVDAAIDRSGREDAPSPGRKLRLLDLFSGIGGFSLGLERSGGFETVAFCEISAPCRHLLAHHWPDVPCHEDVKALTGKSLGRIDAICGGFPCQDISLAGKGAGLAGERSGLWREYARLIGELRPSFIIVENVSALLVRGMGTVLGDLAALGYDCWWDCIPACAVGAPHRRDRLWIVAYARGQQHEGFGDAIRREIAKGLSEAASHAAGNGWFEGSEVGGGGAEGIGPRSEHGLRHGGEAVADPEHGGRERRHTDRPRTGSAHASGWWLAEPNVGRVANGVPATLDGVHGDHEEEHNSQGGAEGHGSGDGLPGVWGDGTAGASPPGLFETGRGGGVVPELPRNGGPSRRNPEGEGAEELHDLRRGVHADAQQEAHHLQPGMSGGGGPSRSRETVGWATEPAVPRVAHGVPARVDRLHGLGNAVVPQIPELIGRAIAAAILTDGASTRQDGTDPAPPYEPSSSRPDQ